jgi:hypothetical protein
MPAGDPHRALELGARPARATAEERVEAQIARVSRRSGHKLIESNADRACKGLAAVLRRRPFAFRLRMRSFVIRV